MKASLVLLSALTAHLAFAQVPTVKDEIILNGKMERIEQVASAYKFMECVADDDACQDIAEANDKEDSKAVKSTTCENEDEDKPLACSIK